jgi:hypothetical protein
MGFHRAGQLDKQTMVGLSTVLTPFDFDSTSLYNITNISGQSVDRWLKGGAVTYSYRLREFQGTAETPSEDAIVQSSSKCTMRAKIGYPKGSWAQGGLPGLYQVLEDYHSTTANPLLFGINGEFLVNVKDNENHPQC